jgi:hypothetical protein
MLEWPGISATRGEITQAWSGFLGLMLRRVSYSVFASILIVGSQREKRAISAPAPAAVQARGNRGEFHSTRSRSPNMVL